MDNSYFTSTQSFDFLGFTATTQNPVPQGQVLENQYQNYPHFPVYEGLSNLPAQESATPPVDQQFQSPNGPTSRRTSRHAQSQSTVSASEPDPFQTEESAEEKESFDDAQARRKAQNRAAQRAFRERKEMHLRELEQKVKFLEAENKTITQENRSLQSEVQKFSTEVKILRATSAVNPTQDTRTIEVGPMHFSPTDFIAQFSQTSDKSGASQPVKDKAGRTMLSGVALWNKITAHPLFKEGLVDLPLLIENLKRISECDGLGPVFPEDKVDEALEEASTQADEL